MYERFYGLRERPFDLTPNPKYLCLSARHSEALSNLRYGIAARRGLDYWHRARLVGLLRTRGRAMTPLDAALEYADRGWPVFPMAFNRDPDAKKYPLTTHGMNDATRDAIQLKEWWAWRANAVPAIVTGGLCWGFTVLGAYAVARLFPSLGVVGPWTMAMTYGAILGSYLLVRFQRGCWKDIRLGPAAAAFEVIMPPAECPMTRIGAPPLCGQPPLCGGSKSPAICAFTNRLYGMSWLNARITQSR